MGWMRSILFAVYLLIFATDGVGLAHSRSISEDSLTGHETDRTEVIDPVDWRMVFGTAADDQIQSVVTDSAGNIFVGGYSGGLIGYENSWPVGDSEGFVVKISAFGDVIWRYDFDTSGIDIVESLAVDESGKLIVAGRTSGAFGLYSNAGQLDLFVAVLSEDGTLAAIRQFGDERPQHPVSIATASSGRFVIAGYDDVFVVGNAVHDWENGFLMGFEWSSANGIVELWSWEPRPIESDVYLSVVSAQDESGDFFATGYDQPRVGAFVERRSSNGTLIWRQIVSTLSIDVVACALTTSSGRLFIAGTTMLPLAGPALGNSDGFVMELDPLGGSRIWGKQLGSTGGDWISGISLSGNNSIYAVGVADGPVVPNYRNAGSDPFVMEIGFGGNILRVWQSRASTSMLHETAFLPGYIVVPSTSVGSAILAGNLDDGPSGPTPLGRLDAELGVVHLQPWDEIFSSTLESFVH